LHFIEGPNGAGKSTLLAVLATVLRPTAGRVTYEPVGSDLRQVRQHLGWLAHDSHCYRDLTPRENISFAAEVYGLDANLAYERVRERVDLHAFENQPLGTLSRGQRQKTALARALVHEPSVLLLDEPFTGLDGVGQARLEAILEEERARGTIVILVSHASAIQQKLGGRLLRLERGRVAESP
jgi:heme exporter protein A